MGEIGCNDIGLVGGGGVARRLGCQSATVAWGRSEVENERSDLLCARPAVFSQLVGCPLCAYMLHIRIFGIAEG